MAKNTNITSHLEQALKDQEYELEHGNQRLRHIEAAHRRLQEKYRAQEAALMAKIQSKPEPFTTPYQHEKGISERADAVLKAGGGLEYSAQGVIQAYQEQGESTTAKVAARMRTVTKPEYLDAQVNRLSRDRMDISSDAARFRKYDWSTLNRLEKAKTKKIGILVEQARRESQKQLLDPELVRQLEQQQERDVATASNENMPLDIREQARIRAESGQAKIDKLKTTPTTNIPTLQEAYRNIDTVQREKAAIIAVKHDIEKEGASPQQTLERARKNLNKIKQQQNPVIDEKQLEESREAVKKALQNYAEKTNKLADLMDKNADGVETARVETNKAEEELRKAKLENKDAEKRDVEDKKRSMGRFQALMSIGQDTASTLGNAFSGIPMASARLGQGIDVDVTNRQLQAQIGIGEIANERFFEQMNAPMNARALRRYRTNQSAREINAARMIGEKTQQNTQNIIDAQVIGKSIDAITGTVSSTASGLIGAAPSLNPAMIATGAGMGALKGITAGISDPALVGMATEYEAATRGLQRSEQFQQNLRLEQQKNDVMFKVPDYLAQGVLDYRRNMSMNTRGLGGRRGGITEELNSGLAVATGAMYGMSQQDLIQSTGAGRTLLGSDFRTKDIFRGGELAQSGYLASPEQYLQARGMLSNVGGKQEDLEDIMQRAVAAGFDSSKQMMQMVEATAQLASRESKMGMDVVGGTGAMLAAGIEGLRGTNLSDSAKAAAVSSAIEAGNASIADPTITVSKMLLANKTVKRFGDQELFTQEKLQHLTLSEMSEMRRLNKAKDIGGLKDLATRAGVYSAIIDPATGTITDRGMEQLNDVSSTMLTNLGKENIPFSNQTLEKEYNKAIATRKLPDDPIIRSQIIARFPKGFDIGSLFEVSSADVGKKGTLSTADLPPEEQIKRDQATIEARGSIFGRERTGTSADVAREAKKNLSEFGPDKLVQNIQDAMDNLNKIPAATFSSAVGSFDKAVTRWNDIMDIYIGEMRPHYDNDPSSNVDAELRKP